MNDNDMKYYAKDGMIVFKDTMRYDYKENKWLSDFDGWFQSVGSSNDADPVSEDEAREIVKKNGGTNFDS